MGLAERGVTPVTWRVTLMVLSGPGPSLKTKLPVVLEFNAAPPHPVTACREKFWAVAVAEALPETVLGVTPTPAGRPVLSIENGVPPVAVEVSAMFCAAPGV